MSTERAAAAETAIDAAAAAGDSAIDADGAIDGGRSPLAARFEADVAALDREISEIELLVGQARAEAGRHEQRRSAVAARAEGTGASADARELAEIHEQLLTATRRAALMESQVSVLEGKLKALDRFRDAVTEYAAVNRGQPAAGAGDRDAGGEPGEIPPAVSRTVLAAQEDLRRDIARAMHDGPAQSLTNIVLQAQIVERTLARDPAAAGGEVTLLVAMVQQTLEATKSFIFDIRPMVLDDLGLVPTLRRATRERGRRAGVGVTFESLGADRRLPVDVESGLFRILDEALTAYLEAGAERVWLRLDWADRLTAALGAARGGPDDGGGGPAGAAGAGAGGAGAGAGGSGGGAGFDAGRTDSGRGWRGRRIAEEPADLPPALAAMVEERQAAAAEAARAATTVELPERIWREIAQRARTIGVEAELLEDGAEIRLVASLSDERPASE